MTVTDMNNQPRITYARNFPISSQNFQPILICPTWLRVFSLLQLFLGFSIKLYATMINCLLNFHWASRSHLTVSDTFCEPDRDSLAFNPASPGPLWLPFDYLCWMPLPSLASSIWSCLNSIAAHTGSETAIFALPFDSGSRFCLSFFSSELLCLCLRPLFLNFFQFLAFLLFFLGKLFQYKALE